jgi:hypothetical protein
MKITVVIFLVLAAFGSWAQDVINLSPVQTENLKPGGCVRHLLKQNHVTRDSLVTLMSQKILRDLKTRLPDAEFILVDSTFLKLLADSSVLKQSQTTSNLDVINGVAGSMYSKTQKKDKAKYYDGRNFTAGGIALGQEMMLQKQIKYFVLLNKFEADADFEIHFELYDSSFTKIYGNKFARPQSLSRNMFFSTFLYYLDHFLESFDEELLNKIKKANAIRK